uniref:Uncharacterized protein n=1 Tax=Tanacetum cinerariifolium TaxID=118510 RepID=A0A699HHU1_TANCI|nr:hypothetical protein [Tanacetum cinerariifolium]
MNQLVRLLLEKILKRKFLSKYCPRGCTTKKMEETNNFQQEPYETLYQAWERFKELLGIKKVDEKVYAAQVGCKSCNGPHYTKDYRLKGEGNTLEEAYYAQFGVPFPQGGRYRPDALGFYQRYNGNPSYQERRQTMEESLSKFMAESAKRRDDNYNFIKIIQASSNQGASIKALEI